MQRFKQKTYKKNLSFLSNYGSNVISNDEKISNKVENLFIGLNEPFVWQIVNKVYFFSLRGFSKKGIQWEIDVI